METKPTLTRPVMATSLPLAWLAMGAPAIAQQDDERAIENITVTAQS
ncbi:hypothetical protein [Alteromonas sp. C1M14]|nr:hypothetical protein [Alteromonas sp. C1M14]MBU2980044.1 hypothetical protein [Alteromonas sp. C1M14]